MTQRTRYLVAAILWTVVIFILHILPARLFAQTTTFGPTPIPFSSPELIRPWAGAESWHDQAVVNIPTSGTPHNPKDLYIRSFFHWYQLETALGIYDFDGVVRPYIQTAIDRNQKFGIGLMTLRVGTGITYDGAGSTYPEYLHDSMQAEPVYKDWIGGEITEDWWVPNYNSGAYQRRLDSLHANLARWLDTANYGGVTFDKVVRYVDIRGVGDYGEWHHVDHADARYWAEFKVPLVASLEKIVQSHLDRFGDKYWLVAIDGLFDCYTLNNTWNPPGIADYVLRATYGGGKKIGIRRDNFGSNNGWIDTWLQNNGNGDIDGKTFGQVIADRWKLAPFIGEPNNGGDGGSPDRYTHIAQDMRDHHVLSFGNGNISGNTTNDNDSIRLASKLAGYRLRVDSGYMTTAITTGTPFTLSLDWKNDGLTPTYEHWDVVYVLKSGTTTVWTDTSSFDPYLWWSSDTTITENFTIPTALIDSGVYSLYVKLVDPSGYRNEPMPLHQTDDDGDGAYLLRSSISVDGGVGGYEPPPSVASWFFDGDPVGSTNATDGEGVTLGMKFRSDRDGVISQVRFWKTVGSTGTHTIKIYLAEDTTELWSGTYISETASGWQVLSTGGTPVAIDSGVLYLVAFYAPDGRYARTLAYFDGDVINGAITGPASASVGGNGVYNYGGTMIFPDQTFNSTNYWVDIYFETEGTNIPPVSAAGSDQLINTPTSSVTLSGSGTDVDGSIASYAWTLVSGPNTPTIVSPTTGGTSVTGLVAGVYVFRLTVTDDGGLTDADDVTITVNVPPSANAGSDQVIVLPTNSVSLTGSGTDTDGTIVGYAWSYVSGPGGYTITTPSSQNTTVTGLVQGVYVFRLTVTDNRNVTGTDDVQVTVNPEPVPPPVGTRRAWGIGNRKIKLRR